MPTLDSTVPALLEPGRTRVRYFKELLQYAHLILSFAQRDVRARYRQTVFGAAWAVLQPFSLMLIFTLVFSRFARVPSDGVPYPLFAYSALVFWTFFSSSLSQGTLAMTANGALVRKIYFPRETLLLAVLLSTSFDLAVAFTLFLALCAYLQLALTWAALWVIPLLLLQALFTLALICFTSAVHVYYRDIAHGLPLLLQIWLFASPVVYPMSVVPANVLPWYRLNPMALLMEGYRRALLSGQGPDLAPLGVAFVGVHVLLIGAYLFFKRAERTFADVI